MAKWILKIRPNNILPIAKLISQEKIQTESEWIENDTLRK